MSQFERPANVIILYPQARIPLEGLPLALIDLDKWLNDLLPKGRKRFLT